jgi:hypothetical protein
VPGEYEGGGTVTESRSFYPATGSLRAADHTAEHTDGLAAAAALPPVARSLRGASGAKISSPHGGWHLRMLTTSTPIARLRLRTGEPPAIEINTLEVQFVPGSRVWRLPV